jgi:hypothetical protein
MGRNVVPNLRAGGNITPSTFVMLDTTPNDNQGLQCTANTLPVGISDVWTQDPPGVSGSGTYIATLGYQIGMFGLGDVCNLMAGSGGFNAGQLLKSDASGNGIPIATSGGLQAYGAVALETTPANQLGLVRVQVGYASPDGINGNGSIGASYVYNGTNLAVTGSFFTLNRAYTVTGIQAYIDIVGSNGSAVTGQIAWAPSGTAISAGTVLHTGTINLKGTASTIQTMTLTGTLLIPSGSTIGFILTGTSTAAQGTVTVNLLPS